MKYSNKSEIHTARVIKSKATILSSSYSIQLTTLYIYITRDRDSYQKGVSTYMRPQANEQSNKQAAKLRSRKNRCSLRNELKTIQLFTWTDESKRKRTSHIGHKL